MPFAVALLAHPAGVYACIVVAVAALVHAYHSRAFVPAFTGASAAALTILAFLLQPPDAFALLGLALGVLLLHAELRFATYGAAAILGLAVCTWSSWRLLAAACSAAPALSVSWRAAVAVAGTLLVGAAVLRGMRLRTLPRR